jgi:hypothetical protein
VGERVEILGQPRAQLQRERVALLRSVERYQRHASRALDCHHIGCRHVGEFYGHRFIAAEPAVD